MGDIQWPQSATDVRYRNCHRIVSLDRKLRQLYGASAWPFNEDALFRVRMKFLLFAMGRHPEAGRDSAVQLLYDEDVLRLIYDWMTR